ncbi:MAG TPA: DsbA family protein [Chitinophaga sp.]|nr:DsbA family protein [Chitinophaga sp.]
MEQHAPTRKNKVKQAIPPLQVTYYTDPLCCWSWAFEPVIQKLREGYGNSIAWRNCMGGMLSQWKSYHDTLHAVSRPIQMGPVWMQARQLTGVTLNDSIWFSDPPASSYPACVAVKCAGLQSATAEELYLYKLRSAVMTAGKNIAKKEVLLALAGELAAEQPGCFNAEQFATELAGEAAINAFRADLQEVRYRNITRFPSLLFVTGSNKKSLLLTGSHSYETIVSHLKQLTGNA